MSTSLTLPEGVKLTPPPTKEELLRATAIALARENRDKRQAAWDRVNELMKQLGKLADAEASKQPYEFTFDNYHAGITQVRRLTKLPNTPEMERILDEMKQIKKSAPPEKNSSEYLKELRAAGKPQSRAGRIADNPEVREALVKAGHAMLAAAAAQAPAIEA